MPGWLIVTLIILAFTSPAWGGLLWFLLFDRPTEYEKSQHYQWP